jgi:hypothetical protein
MNEEKENEKFNKEDIALRDTLFNSALSGLTAKNSYADNNKLFDVAFKIAVQGVLYLKDKKPSKLKSLFRI